MSGSKFTITLKGDDADDSLRLSDLIDQLNSVKQVLNQIDRQVTGKKRPTLYYRITKLSMNSPASIEIEAVSGDEHQGHGQMVVGRLNSDLDDVIHGRRPKNADIDLLESYKTLVQPLKRHVTQFVFRFNESQIDVPKTLDAKVEEILGPDQIEFGSITGSLDVIDVHNGKNLFKVYPVVGPSTIRCHFRKEMLAKAVEGIQSFVKISGEMHYKKTEKFPHFMEVSDIQVIPEQSDLPLLSSLRGIAKNAYDGLSSTDYVERIRNGDW